MRSDAAKLITSSTQLLTSEPRLTAGFIPLLTASSSISPRTWSDFGQAAARVAFIMDCRNVSPALAVIRTVISARRFLS
jgi:hypothetical protein